MSSLLPLPRPQQAFLSRLLQSMRRGPAVGVTSPLKCREASRLKQAHSPTNRRCLARLTLGRLAAWAEPREQSIPAGSPVPCVGPRMLQSGDAISHAQKSLLPVSGHKSTVAQRTLPGWDSRPGARPRAGSGPRWDLASAGHLWPQPLRASHDGAGLGAVSSFTEHSGVWNEGQNR